MDKKGNLKGEWRKNGSHNTERKNGNEGYIIRRIMLTNVTISTIYCVEMRRNTRYLVRKLT